MGMFDFFGKEPSRTRTESSNTKNDWADKTVERVDDTNQHLAVFTPSSYQDVELIIDNIKTGKNAVVHLTELKTETAVRVLDMLSGAIYALGGGLYEVEKNVFMFSPSGVKLY